MLNYSEITAKYPFPLDAVFAQPLRKLLSSQSGVSSKDSVLVPMVVVQAFLEGQVIPAIPGANTPSAFTFTLRSGTVPDDHIYFSAAPLDSEAHLSYLDELEAALSY